MEINFQEIIGTPVLIQLTLVFIGMIIILIIRNLVRSRLSHYVKDQNNYYRGKKALNVVGYLLMVFLITIIFRKRLETLTVFFGIAGVGVTLALQEVIVSIAGWSAILFTDIFKTGDRVMMGDIKGDVIDVGVLRTTIMEMGGWVDGDLYNGRIVRVANSFVFKAPVYNYSADFPFLWDDIKVPIQFGSNYSLTREILYEVANDVVGEYSREAEKHWDIMLRKYLIEDASTYPMVTIIADDNWVEFTLRYVVDYKKRLGVKDQLFTKILEKIENTSDQIKFASATFSLTDIASLEVNFKKEDVL